MKITIESTTRFVQVNGKPCRVWGGTTQNGIKVQCLIPQIAAQGDADQTIFQRELEECRAPQQEPAFPLRMLL